MSLFGRASLYIVSLCIQKLKYVTSKIPTVHLKIHSNIYLVSILYAMWLLLFISRGGCPNFADVEVTRKVDRHFRAERE